MLRQAFGKWALAVTVAGSLVAGPGLQARTAEPVPGSLPPVSLSRLPEQAQQTYQRVLSGGPFRYGKDGTVFGNRERLLPLHSRGYYREYTVPTPGLTHRGARRIVCGGETKVQPDVCYYTSDHYASFSRIVQ